MKNKTLWMMSGVPGSGKTYQAHHFFMQGPGWRYISRDEIRFNYLADDEEYFAHESEIFEIFIYKLKEAINGEGIYNIIADATHLNWPSRKKLLINLKHEVNFDTLNIVPTVVKAPKDLCIKRNQMRSGRAQVPDHIIESMWENLTDPATDPFHYDGILYLCNTQEEEKN